jgi:phosphate starvation-inducible PhoH-like protein
LTTNDHNSPARAELTFEDETHLPNLFGAYDRHLARLEREFGVSVASRGGNIAITGSANSVASAETALRWLYDSAQSGQVINEGKVSDAVRTARFGKLDTSAAIDVYKNPIQPRSGAQSHYVETIRRSKLTFAAGPAGTGKTFLAVAVAVEMMKRRMVDRIILSRPAVEAGEKLGFLPGDLREKVDPYLRPLKDALMQMMPADMVDRRLANEEIEAAPLAFMRGRTLAHAFIILDEAQNTTPMQMKMALTRIGEGSRMVVTGDPSQTDLPPGQRSGLSDALEILPGLKDVSVSNFSAKDVVREDLVAAIVSAYDSRQRRLSESPDNA